MFNFIVKVTFILVAIRVVDALYAEQLRQSRRSN